MILLINFFNEWKFEVSILTSWNAEKLFHSLISLLTLPLKLCYYEQIHNNDLPRAAILSTTACFEHSSKNAIWMATPVPWSPAAYDTVEEKLLHVLN